MSLGRFVGIALLAASGVTGCVTLTVEQSQRVVSTTPYRLEPRWIPAADHVELDAAVAPTGLLIRLDEAVFCEVEEGKDVTTERTVVKSPDWVYTVPKMAGIAAGAVLGGLLLTQEEPCEDLGCLGTPVVKVFQLVLVVAATSPFITSTIGDFNRSGTETTSNTERRPTQIKRVPCPIGVAPRVVIRLSGGEILRAKQLGVGRHLVGISEDLWERYSDKLEADVYVRDRIIRHIEINRGTP